MSHQLHHLVEVANELGDVHRLRRDSRVEGGASPALLPINNPEMVFQQRIIVTKERGPARAAPAVKQYQRRLDWDVPRNQLLWDVPPMFASCIVAPLPGIRCPFILEGKRVNATRGQE